MRPGSDNPNQLVVEGQEDLYAVVELLRPHIGWPDSSAGAPVYINVGGGVQEILKPAYLNVLLKSRQIHVLGVILDGNSTPSGRYQRFRDICRSQFPSVPPEAPPEGLVVENTEEKRLGLWIMPDKRR